MAVATLEDLQGTLEVVVFPRMYVTSGGTFAEGAILLVAGRVDHRGEEASLLADAVWVWEDAATRGPAAIAQ
jgi:DNA polymerase-3 subunit alpha